MGLFSLYNFHEHIFRDKDSLVNVIFEKETRVGLRQQDVLLDWIRTQDTLDSIFKEKYNPMIDPSNVYSNHTSFTSILTNMPKAI